MIQKSRFSRIRWLWIVSALGAALYSSHAVYASHEQVLISETRSGERKMDIEWTRVDGDTMSPRQRVFVPFLRFNVSNDLGIPASRFLNRDEVIGRGAGFSKGEDFFVQVGNQNDFFKIGQEPASQIPVSFDVTGVFQFGEDLVGVGFSEEVDQEQALDIGNYDFTPPLAIESVSVQDNGKTVILKTASPLPSTQLFTAIVTGISSRTGRRRTSSIPFSFQTAVAPVVNISEIHDDLAAYLDLTVSVVGQVYIPVGSRGGTASGYVQDGSGRGINLFGGGIQGAVNALGNVVQVTGTVVDSLSAVRIIEYGATVLASGQPQLGARVLPLKGVRSTRWEGTFIQTAGGITRIDRDSTPGLVEYTTTQAETTFAGYRVWRTQANAPSKFVHLRSYSLLDTTWTFDPDDPGKCDRCFSDPDSIIARGTEREREPDEIPGPFNGVGYLYAVTWFDAVIDATIFPTRVTLFERSSVAEAVLDQVLFPNREARGRDPLLADVKVVPNPYNPSAPFGRQAFPGAPRVQFTNLPSSAQIDIYSVAGDLVRTLRKENDPDTDVMVWDLRNEEDEKISSGIYMYLVRAGGESTTGRFVIAR